MNTYTIRIPEPENSTLKCMEEIVPKTSNECGVRLVTKNNYKNHLKCKKMRCFNIPSNRYEPDIDYGEILAEEINRREKLRVSAERSSQDSKLKIVYSENGFKKLKPKISQDSTTTILW